MQTISLVTVSLGASSRANVKCLITLCNEHHAIRVDNIQHSQHLEFARQMSQELPDQPIGTIAANFEQIMR